MANSMAKKNERIENIQQLHIRISFLIERFPYNISICIQDVTDEKYKYDRNIRRL